MKCFLQGGRLLQQYIVDAVSSMEESRLLWMRNNQKILRAKVYKGLVNIIDVGDSMIQVIGKHGRTKACPTIVFGTNL